MLFPAAANQHQMAAASVKAYRELLRRLKQQHQGEEQASTLLQASERLRNGRARRRDVLNPRRAFKRLRDRLLVARADFRSLKQEKAERWRARYAALREMRAPGRALEETAVLGSDGLLRTVVLGSVGALSRLFMNTLCTFSVEGRETLDAAFARPAGQGLVTVSNHVASLDDPLVVAALMPGDALLQPAAFRWGLCATDRCFKGGLVSAFFRAGKTLPVERGAGLQQAGMLAAVARLEQGDWVHVFPEGTRSRDGRMGPLRRGVGHLIASCERPPLVVPFVHSGMEQVIPPGASVPRAGANISVLVGRPIAVDDLLAAAQVQQWPEARLSGAITQRIARHLYALKAALEAAPLNEVVRPGALAVTRELEGVFPPEGKAGGKMQTHIWLRLAEVMTAGGISASRQPKSASAHPDALPLQLQTDSRFNALLASPRWLAGPSEGEGGAMSQLMRAAKLYFGQRRDTIYNMLLAA